MYGKPAPGEKVMVLGRLEIGNRQFKLKIRPDLDRKLDEFTNPNFVPLPGTH